MRRGVALVLTIVVAAALSPAADAFSATRLATVVSPVAEYDHGSGCAITGGYVYRAARYPALQGTYFYGDFCSGNVWSLRASGGTVTSGPTLEPINVADLSSFGEGPSGGLYLVSLDGDVYYLTYS